MNKRNMFFYSNYFVSDLAELKLTIESKNTTAFSKVITFSDNFDTNITANFTITVPNDYPNNIIIDGNNKILKRTHISGTLINIINNNTNFNKFTINNLSIEGLVQIDSSDLPIYDSTTSGGGLALKKGIYELNNINISKASQGVSTSEVSMLTINESTISYCVASSGSGPALYTSSNTNVEIHSSSFTNNAVRGWEASRGGAITFFESENVNIENSLFANNAIIQNKNLGGGAIAFKNTRSNSNININQSYFINNSTQLGTVACTGTEDGGAISLRTESSTAGLNVNIQNSTFESNSAADDGGALLIETRNKTNIVNIKNNTFYKNKAQNLDNPSLPPGGAIQVSLANTFVTFINNTFVENEVHSIYAVTGAAIGHHINGSYNLINNIFTGNKAIINGVASGENVKRVNVSRKASNIATTTITSPPSEFIGNIGYDYDNPAAELGRYTFEKIFGKYPLSLSNNFSDIKAGNPSDGSQKIIPTMSIIPNDGAFLTGIANMTGVPTIAKDQRDFERDAVAADSGAVEIAWVKYSANGDNWDNNLAELTAYDGKIYYEGANPENYYVIDTLNKSYTVKSFSDLSMDPSKYGSWNTEANGSGTEYTEGQTIALGKNLSLYAIPKATYTITYNANGGNGTQTDSNSPYTSGALVTVLSKGMISRSGYTFLSWNTMANGSGTSYNPGNTFNIIANTDLYAIWKKDISTSETTTRETSTKETTTSGGGGNTAVPESSTKTSESTTKGRETSTKEHITVESTSKATSESTTKQLSSTNTENPWTTELSSTDEIKNIDESKSPSAIESKTSSGINKVNPKTSDSRLGYSTLIKLAFVLLSLLIILRITNEKNKLNK